MSVEARFLSGDTVLLSDCDTLDDVKVRIAMMQQRFASDVVVIDDTQQPLTDLDNSASRLVSVVIQPENNAGIDGASLWNNLFLHAREEDTIACASLLDILHHRYGRHSRRSPIDLEMVFNQLSSEPQRLSKIISTLLSVTTPVGAATVKMVQWRNKGCLEMLLSAAADVNIRDCCGTTPLVMALQMGEKDITAMLLSARASVNRTTSAGLTALFAATHDGREDLVTMLLSAAASANAPIDRSCETALSLASSRGHKEVVAMLLSAAACVNGSNSRSLPALSLAASCGRTHVVATLLETVSNVDKSYCWHGTALLQAASNGHANIVAILLLAKACANHYWGGETALSIAASNGYNAVVDRLQSADSANRCIYCTIVPLLIREEMSKSEILSHKQNTQRDRTCMV